MCQGLMSHDISTAQCSLLITLSSQNSCLMSELAQSCHFSSSNATGAIDRLEKQGFVSRAHVAGDRRKVAVTLTPQGKKKLSAILHKLSVD